MGFFFLFIYTNAFMEHSHCWHVPTCRLLNRRRRHQMVGKARKVLVARFPLHGGYLSWRILRSAK